MRKRAWLKIALITLAACAVAGVILAVILFNANPARTYAVSSVEFSFEGAANGLAPNGYRYDLSGLQSDEVLEAALKDAGMEGKYTPDQLRANMIVSGVYPEDIVDQMTGYESLLTGDAGKISVGDYYATLYNVTLYNDFDKSISGDDLVKLLGAVMSEFQSYFERVYSVFLAKDTMLENLSEYDYPQQLEILNVSIGRNLTYADEMAEDHLDFRMNGNGFSDVAVQFENLQTTDLERISGLVTMNALSRNPDRIIAQYENQIKVLKIRLKELETESKDVEALIAEYSKDDIIYVSTSENLQRVGSSSSSTYDTLVARRQEIADSIASLNKELAQVQLKLSDIQGGTAGAAGAAAVTDAGASEAAAAGAESAETAEAKTEAAAAAEGTAAETAAAGVNTEAAAAESAEAAKANAETAAAAATDEEIEAQKAVVEKGIASVVAKLNKATEQFTSFLQAYSERELNDRTVAVSAVRYKAPKLISSAFVVQAIKTAGPLCVLGLMVCIVIMIISQSRAKKKENI